MTSSLNFEQFETQDDAHRYCIFEITDSKNVVRQMSIEKDHSKGAQTLLKSAPQHLDHIYWSLPRQLSWKKYLLLTCPILGLFANILAANDKYPVINSYKLMIPNKMQSYQKQKTFSKSKLSFEHFEKEDDPDRFCMSQITDS